MSITDVRYFITQAQQYSMPTAFLTRLVNEYKFDFETGSGTDHVSYVPWHHELVLYENTWKGLTRPDFADAGSVLNLYHEGTHAYIDLTDYDESQEFGEAMKYYEWARLKNGTPGYVVADLETERVVQEAAAMYVGNRASTVWRTWWRVKFLDQLVKNLSDGKMTVAKAIEIWQSTGTSTIANVYWAAMTDQVFGYVERDGAQFEVADKPIFNKLADFCDRTILENKISDQLIHMPALGAYIDTVYKAAQKFPDLVKATMKP
jgi:hypothetical protein